MHASDEVYVALRQKWLHNGVSRRVHLSSSVWKDVAKLWSRIKDDTGWIIGEGYSINFWNDVWCMDQSISDFLGLPEGIRNSLQSSLSMFVKEGAWWIPGSLVQRIHDIVNSVSSIPIPSNGLLDTPVWKGCNSGVINLRQVKCYLQSPGPSPGWGKLIWNKMVPPTRSCLVWKLLWGRLPVDDMAMRVGVNLASQCSLCRRSVEFMDHLFFLCPVVLQV
ncbi:hypothetical protein Fmac_028222 [Flemingia macrophylla]|uniref:Reverse transcriptase zinc-binding domain-containing protein n=1 Tax=Flemingia macrophylla TaxID=520843 RepID=A0ABD1L7A8_9FABA